MAHTITTYANEAGQWRAEITFDHTMSESDPRAEFNVARQMPNLRRRARRAIINAITEREQKTTETYSEARGRVAASLGRLRIIKQNINSINLWHGVTIGE